MFLRGLRAEVPRRVFFFSFSDWLVLDHIFSFIYWHSSFGSGRFSMSSLVSTSLSLFLSSSSLAREIEFTLLVMGDLASSLISTFLRALLVVSSLRSPNIYDILSFISSRCLKMAFSNISILSVLLPCSPFLMVVEGEVLNVPGFVRVLIENFSASGAVNLALKMKQDMIIKNLDLKPTIDAMMRLFCSKSLKRVHASERDSP
ncbi:hypothetical protein Tco_1506382 [Tanacetum coccineum]